MEQYFAQRIVRVLHNMATRPEQPEGKDGWTRAIEEEIGKLGREFGFVAAHRRNWAWLFDVCWLDYEDFDNRVLRKVALALESEWELAPVDLRVDFNKLLASNAQLAVMIFQDAPRSGFEMRMEQFRASIRAISPQRTSPILFAGYINGSGAFRYLYLENGREMELTPAVEMA